MLNKIIKILVIVLLVVGIGAGVKYLIPNKNQGLLERTGGKIDRQINKIEEKFDKEGPAEKTGKKIDETLEDLNEKVEEMKKNGEK